MTEVRDDKRMTEGSGFTMSEPPEKRSGVNWPDVLVVLGVAAIWILWIIAYFLFIQPFVSYFFFEFLRLPAYPILVHFLLIFVIPVLLIIVGSLIQKLWKKEKMGSI